jgi:hypothetical protein
MEAVSEFIQAYWWAILAGGVAVVYAVYNRRRRQGG